VDSEGAIGRPSCDGRTEVVEDVVASGDLATLCWMGQFGDKKRRRNAVDAGAETNEETAGDEHARVASTRLKTSTESDDKRADEDGLVATKPIGELRSENKRTDTADGLDGVEKTLFGAMGIVEV
jgi:hypothetical protein